jgi:hypothetical protein
VRALATGRFDALSGRFLDARADLPKDLEDRIEGIVSGDLHAVRLRR